MKNTTRGGFFWDCRAVSAGRLRSHLNQDNSATMSGPLTRASLFSSRKIVYGTHGFFVFLAVAMSMIAGPVEAACGIQPFKPHWSNTLGGNNCNMGSDEVTMASTLPTCSFYYANAFCGDGDTCCPQGYTPSCSGSGSNVYRWGTCGGCVMQQATCTNLDAISTIATSGNSKTSVLQMHPTHHPLCIFKTL